MLKNAKAKRSRNERRSRDIFLKAGCDVVKAGGSLGLFDLIVIDPYGKVVGIQVKTNGWPGRVETEGLLKWAMGRPTATVLIHRWDDRARAPRVKRVVFSVESMKWGWEDVSDV